MSLSILFEKLPRAVLFVAGVLITHQLALLTWSLIPSEKSAAPWEVPKNRAAQNSNKLNTQSLQSVSLFGQYTAKKESKPAVRTAPDRAPKTRLNLTLVGVVAASDPTKSSAIIANAGQQGSYFIDSDIPGTSATVSHIYQDRVILMVNGGAQTLMLDGVEQVSKQHSQHESKGKQQSKTLAKVAPSKSRKDFVKVNLDRKALIKNPSKLSDFIRISPVREKKALKGYRVKPGKDRSLFDQAGLKSGDLIVELNGIDLTDTQQAFTLLKEFPSMTEMSLTVQRGGQLHEMYISIP